MTLYITDTIPISNIGNDFKQTIKVESVWISPSHMPHRLVHRALHLREDLKHCPMCTDLCDDVCAFCGTTGINYNGDVVNIISTASREKVIQKRLIDTGQEFYGSDRLDFPKRRLRTVPGNTIHIKKGDYIFLCEFSDLIKMLKGKEVKAIDFFILKILLAEYIPQ
jgi:hypothetical protein